MFKKNFSFGNNVVKLILFKKRFIKKNLKNTQSPNPKFKPIH